MNSSSVVPGSDRELLLAIGRGEPQAIAVLFQRHGPRMVSFARRYVADPAAAEDVVVSLLGRWLERPPLVRDAEKVSAFLAASVYHASVDWVRRERAERGQPPRSRTGQGSDDERRAGPIASPDSASSPEHLRARLAIALEQLSNDERLLLESHYGHALTAEECMANLRISRAAFHQRLHRARRHLADLLAMDERGEQR